MSPHLDLETLAALAEGALRGERGELARAHLGECRSCTAAYADAVRYRAAWLAQPEAFASNAVGSSELSQALRVALGRPARTRTWLVAAAALIVLGPAGAWLLGRAPRSAAELELPAGVRAVIEESSSRGLVMPGGERFAARLAPAMRSGTNEVSPELESEADSLVAAYEQHRDSAELAAQLVAALLAANDLDAARDYAREGLRRDPHNVRLLILHAGALDRGSDVAGAESLLRTARRIASDDPLVELDLALVLRQRGNTAEAMPLLQRVARSHRRSLAERAVRELGSGS